MKEFKRPADFSGVTHIQRVKLTDAKRAKMLETATKIYELLKEATDDPGEGYSIICFVMKAMEETYGMSGMYTEEHGDQPQ